MLHISHKGQRARTIFSQFQLHRRTTADQMFHRHPMLIGSAWRQKCPRLHSHTYRRTTLRRRLLRSIRRKDHRCSRFKPLRFVIPWVTSACLATTDSDGTESRTESRTWFSIEVLKQSVQQRQLHQHQVALRHRCKRENTTIRARD